MPEQLTQIDQTRPQREAYPYSEWVALARDSESNAILLVYGTDYTCGSNSFHQTLRRAMKRYGIPCSIKRHERGWILAINTEE